MYGITAKEKLHVYVIDAAIAVANFIPCFVSKLNKKCFCITYIFETWKAYVIQ